jgi:flagellar FliJ protein
MTTNPHQVLHTLLQREEDARDAALLACRRAVEQLGHARDQAEHLERHRGETIARWNERARQHASVEMLNTYRNFLQRLDQALAQQRMTVSRLDVLSERAREELVAAETRVAAVRKLIERRVQSEHRAAQQRDQKRTDEAAQRAGWRASQTSDFGSLY